MIYFYLFLTCPDLFLGARLEKLPLAPGFAFCQNKWIRASLSSVQGRKGDLLNSPGAPGFLIAELVLGSQGPMQGVVLTGNVLSFKASSETEDKSTRKGLSDSFRDPSQSMQNCLPALEERMCFCDLLPAGLWRTLSSLAPTNRLGI